MSSSPSRSLANSTYTDIAAPNVTLNRKIVRNSARTGGFRHSQRIPSAISRRRWRSSGVAAGAGRAAMRDTRTAPASAHTASSTNGLAIANANRNAPSGGPRSWLVTMFVPDRRAFATPSPAFGTVVATRAPPALSANVSAVPMRNTATKITGSDTVPVAIVIARPPRTRARSRLTRIDSRRRSWRSMNAPAGIPMITHGSCWRNTERGDRESAHG